MRYVLIATALALLPLTGIAVAQNEPLKFEVASIKPNISPGPGSGAQFLPGGRFAASGTTLWAMMLMAYRVASFQIEVPKGLDWVSETLYDVDAKADPSMIPAGPLDRNSTHQIELMLQALLADRFHLSLRHETRTLASYALLAGKDGTRVQRPSMDRDCAAVPSPCGLRGGRRAGIQGLSVDMAQVAQILSGFLGQPVFDQTGLAGRFDIAIPPFTEGTQGADPALPSIFSVLEDIGLRLESRKMPVDIYIVDHAEKPDAN